MNPLGGFTSLASAYPIQAGILQELNGMTSTT